MKIAFADPNIDYVVRNTHALALSTPRATLEKSVLAILPKEERVALMKKEEATQYFIKKHEAIIVNVPKLSEDKSFAVVQLAIAVGRRLERFERGRKANATRTPNSRKEIAQNAIQARWSAK